MSSPRFILSGRRGHAHDLSEPLPETLARLPQIRTRAKAHLDAVARLKKLHERQAELARDLAEAERVDAAEAAKASVADKPASASKASHNRLTRLTELLGECEADVRRLEDAVPLSASELLALAEPHFATAAERARKGEDEALARAGEAMQAVDAALADASRLADEHTWLVDAIGKERIEPYRDRGARGELAQLRSKLSGVFGESLERYADHRAQAEQQQQWEAEQQAELERQAERLGREDAAARVRFEGATLTHAGGRRVKPTPGFGFAPVEGDEGEDAEG
jgi:hypothetical protein